MRTIQRLGAYAAFALAALVSPRALADAPPPAAQKLEASWNTRYREARRDLDAGRFGRAYEQFLRLIDEASLDSDRELAREMAAVCRAQLERAYGVRIQIQPV